MGASEFFPLAVVHFMAVVSPGPDLAVTMKSTLGGGRFSGIRTALGISAGNLIHVAYTLVGLGILLQSSPTIFRLVALAGAAYLAYLGVMMLRSAHGTWKAANAPKLSVVQEVSASESAVATTTIQPFKPLHPFRMGFLTNATNPKTTLFFVAIFNTMVSPTTPWVQKLGYGLWMCCVSATWFAAVSVLLSNARLRQRYTDRLHWIDGVLGIMLLLLAVRVAVT
jgi:threonine/homoserine/homoserine lactone efflux protein